MNVLFIVTSLYGGGAERVVARLSSEFCREHNVHVSIWPEALGAGAYDHDDRVVVHELAHSRLRNTRLRRIPGLVSSSRWHQLRTLKKQLGIDVAVSFLTVPNQDNVLSKAGERTIVSIRSLLAPTEPSDPRAAKKVVAQIRRAGKRADNVVAVSKVVGDEQVSRYGVRPEKITTIYNPIDAAAFEELAAEPLDDPAFADFCARHKQVVITVGRLTWQKGQWHLVRALSEVRKHADVGLVILGQGEEEGRLRWVAEANGLADHMLLAGFHPNPFPYLVRSNAFAMPSIFEGFSNALLEAMAVGVPIVACDSDSGARELLAPDTSFRTKATGVEEAEFGMLVPRCSGNAELSLEPLEPAETDLAEALLRLLTNDQLRSHYVQNGALRIADFSTERIAGQWAQIMGIPYNPTGRTSVS